MKRSIRVLVLVFLSGDRRRTNTELARELNVSPASLSSATHRLWKQGLLKRDGSQPYVYSHQHKWRIGRLNEFPQGQMGCACGARAPFNIWEGR